MLYGARMVAERETYMNFEKPEMYHTRPFYYVVVAGKPFICSSGEDCVLQLLTTFLNGGS